jgi:hypothetical protein
MTQESARLKRPSLFVIRGIIDTVDKSIDHRARFGDLARCTPELRNRGKMIQYLKLLVDELGWLEKKDELRSTRRNLVRANRRERQWTVAYYVVTNPGRSFLELFPSHRVLEDEEDDLPTPEQQERNWKEWLGQS